MRKYITLGVIALIVGLGIVGFLRLPKASNAQQPTSANTALTFASIQSEVSAGTATLYDVRTAEEYAQSHFPGAKNFALQTIQVGQYPPVAKDAKIYVYCHSGNRSGQATTLLKNAGYTNIIDLHGLPDVQAIGGVLQTN